MAHTRHITKHVTIGFVICDSICLIKVTSDLRVGRRRSKKKKEEKRVIKATLHEG